MSPDDHRWSTRWHQMIPDEMSSDDFRPRWSRRDDLRWSQTQMILDVPYPPYLGSFAWVIHRCIYLYLQTKNIHTFILYICIYPVELRAKPPLCLSIGRNRWILETFETAKPGMELGQVDGRSGGRKGGRTFKESWQWVTWINKGVYANTPSMMRKRMFP